MKTNFKSKRSHKVVKLKTEKAEKVPASDMQQQDLKCDADVCMGPYQNPDSARVAAAKNVVYRERDLSWNTDHIKSLTNQLQWAQEERAVLLLRLEQAKESLERWFL